MEEGQLTLGSIPGEIVFCIATFLDPASQVYFAVSSKNNYAILSKESLVWWRIREIYVNSEDYEEDRSEYDGWWSDFVERKTDIRSQEWPTICFHSIIVWGSLGFERVDDEMLYFGLSLDMQTCYEAFWTFVDDVGKYIINLGRLDLMEDVCYRYYLDDTFGCQSHEDYIIKNVEELIPKDNVEKFVIYMNKRALHPVFSKGKDWDYFLERSIECGSPKIVTAILNMFVPSSQTFGKICLCKFIDSRRGKIFYGDSKFNSNKHDELPRIVCEEHGKALQILHESKAPKIPVPIDTSIAF